MSLSCLPKVNTIEPQLGLPCLSLPSPSAQRFYAWAEKLFDSGRFNEALDAYDECLKLDSSNTKALYKRGLTKGVLKNTEGCLRDLNTILLQSFLKETDFFETFFEKMDEDYKVQALTKSCPYSYELFDALRDFEALNISLDETAQEIEELTLVLPLYVLKLNKQVHDLLSPVDHKNQRKKKTDRQKKILGEKWLETYTKS